jgi:nucleotide-binding universal stress UspA family protein
MHRTIVLGYDGSDCARAALDVAIAQALGEEGAAIALVYGHELPLGFRREPPPGSEDADQLKAFKERVGAEAQTILNEAEGRIADAGVEVACHVIWHEPTAALIEAADNTGASMIVVGTHGESALGGMLRGSVAYDLLHHSPVPVLVVPHRTSAAA